MKNIWILVLALTGFNLFPQAFEVKGTVFDDKNGNNHWDPGEEGVEGVVVSDQLKATITDDLGNFLMESTADFPYVFISMPTGYSGSYYLPKAGELKFPIRKSNPQDEFQFIHASDPHIDSLNLPRMERFRTMVDSLGVNFVIVTGDLVRDALRVNEGTAGNYYQMYVTETKKMSIPVFSGVGNHEIFGIERDKSGVAPDHPLYGKKMFRKFLGPNYYSFNYGGLHFISLDAVGYQDTYYYGGVDSVQLDWLETDLNYIGPDTPVITFNHIPLVSPGFSFQMFESHKFYGPQLLFQNDTLRHRHIAYNFKEVKKRIGKRAYPLALAGHYHAVQEATIAGSGTIFAQTSAITGPDQFYYNGFQIRSGFTLYKVKDKKIISRTFIPLNFK